jgi:hypothetical protein
MSAQHSQACRDRCCDGRPIEAYLLHELVEHTERITRVAEAGAQLLGPMLKGRLAKMAGARAVAKVQAEWRAGDERQ